MSAGVKCNYDKSIDAVEQDSYFMQPSSELLAGQVTIQSDEPSNERWTRM